MKTPSSAVELIPQCVHPRIPVEMAMVGAALGPPVACGLLNQLLPVLANTSAALILVLLIVSAACTGYCSAA